MNTRNKFSAIFFGALLLWDAPDASGQVLDLGGQWQVSTTLPGTSAVTLPGTLDMAGVGLPDTLRPAMARPQLLRLTRKYSYIGPASYTKIVDIPADMADKPLRLTMERVLWKSSVKIDGKPVEGCNISLTTPHVFVIPPLSAGKHTVEITVDNRPQRDISVSNLCHSYTNDTQTIWNGILGEFTLSVIPAVDIRGVSVYPDIRTGSLRVKVGLDNSTGRAVRRTLRLSVAEKYGKRVVAKKKCRLDISSGVSEADVALKLDNPVLWSEFDPFLYNLVVSVGEAEASTDFGMREVRTDGKALLVNGKKTFLRGTLDCAAFPLTGVPPTDRAGWIKEMQTLKDWGFNHIRFHSWCPPKAAFEVADSVGLYLQAELPVWSLHIGDDPKVEEFMFDEAKRMSANYGNHPSWIMATNGNELQHDFNVLNRLVDKMKAADPRRLYAASSFTFERGHGGHAEPGDQFFITQWTDDGWVRGQGVFEEEPPAFDRNYARATERLTVPLVSHEIGQYAVYPAISEIEKYTGVLDPLNFKAVRDDLARRGMLDRAEAYKDATVKFAGVLYKEEIERALKTPGFSGVQLLGIQDFPGQGTALVGLIDVFWDPKGDIKGTDFGRFNSSVVPLASFPKAIYTPLEDFEAAIDIVNYSLGSICGEVWWTLTSANDGRSLSGQLAAADVFQGEVKEVGRIRASLAGFKTPAKLTLEVGVKGTGFRNSWNIWVYPDIAAVDCKDVVLTSDLSEATVLLQKGRKVIYMPCRETVKGIESKFLPVFWSPVHFPNQAGGMGVLADPSHPALKGFPNDGHSDWQWWRVARNASVMQLDSVCDSVTGRPIEPMIGVIDNFLYNRRLGYMFEANCNGGKIVVSSVDLTVDSPEIKSMLQGFIDYMASPDFRPAGTVTPSTLSSLTDESRTINKTKATSVYE